MTQDELLEAREYWRREISRRKGRNGNIPGGRTLAALEAEIERRGSESYANRLDRLLHRIERDVLEDRRAEQRMKTGLP
ncbi:MAG: hypothetical protein ACP5EN_09120 [Rhodovulum sp.]